MKATMHGGFLLLFSILQATWISHAEILNVKPNLFLIYVFVLAFFCGSKTESAFVGFIFGLTLDIITGRFLGVNAVCGLIFGFFITYFCERVLGNINVFIVLFSVIFLTLLYEIVYYLFSFSIIKNIDLVYAVKKVIFIESIYNGLLSLPVYFILKGLTKYLYADKGENVG